MNLNITGKDFDLTDSIKNYINDKVSKLSKYIGDEFDATATLKIEGNEQVAEIRITFSGEVIKDFLNFFKIDIAVTASKDLYSSIDKDIDILEGQIRKIKTKKDRQNMTDTIRFQASQSNDEDLDLEGEIIKTIYYSIKPLTPEDAKLILEGDVKNKFLPFINIDTNAVNVIYKLKDGKNFGILEPES